MHNVQDGNKRLFIGVEVHASWPSIWPPGRVLQEEQRHLTLLFLGNVPYKPLCNELSRFPFSLKLGTVGGFDDCLQLPWHHPRVIAWHVRWCDPAAPLIAFQKTLFDALRSAGYVLEDRPWLPHVTLCRHPFQLSEWQKAFAPLPFYTGSLHLYESVGTLNYQPVWSLPLQLPFEEIDHMADMAFIIKGETLDQLYYHAVGALAFKFPDLMNIVMPSPVLHNLDDIVIALNKLIAVADVQIGCPLKAVSFHGDLVSLPHSLLQWEMIVDV